MGDTDIRDTVAAERHDLATMLAGVPADAWDAPSLCAGWRVREVVAHLTMPFRYSMPRVIAEVIRARGNFNRMADRCARRDAAELSADELTASMRDNLRHPWKPPGGGYEGALSHDVIHGLDITVALGVDREVPKDRLRMVLDGLSPKSVRFFGTDLDGVELRADDMDFTYGSGEPLYGAAQHLLLVICGRTLPAGLLRGTPSERYTRT
ncbi:MAG TPA: maleylpyruvate isomerase family mycothiol-dependent enzyme [Jiangellaceae bacterium]